MAKEKDAFKKKFKKDQERSGNFTPFPSGIYPSQISNPKIEKNSSGDGKHLYIEFVFLTGKHKGKIIKEWISFEHSNEQTESIGLGKIASICDCIKLKFEKLQKASELDKKKINITLGQKPAEGSYGPGNKVVSYSPFDKKGIDNKEGKSKGKKDKSGKKKSGKKPF